MSQTHRYVKHPDQGQVFLPGHGRLRDGAVVVGEKFAVFAQGPAPLLAPMSGDGSPAPAPEVESPPQVEVVPSSEDLASAQQMTEDPPKVEVDDATFTATEVKAAEDVANAQAAADEKVEADEEKEPLTQDDLVKATKDELLEIAEANQVEIPKSVKKVKDLRAHLKSALFSDGAE